MIKISGVVAVAQVSPDPFRKGSPSEFGGGFESGQVPQGQGLRPAPPLRARSPRGILGACEGPPQRGRPRAPFQTNAGASGEQPRTGAETGRRPAERRRCPDPAGEAGACSGSEEWETRRPGAPLRT